MRISIIIIILFFSSKISGQERLFFQNDSVYKLNKVKEVKLFNGNRLTSTVFFDKDGRTIKYQGAPVSSGWQRSEYFEYDERGRLIKQFDIIKDKVTKVINYEIEYSNEELTKLTKFNPDGSIDSITYYEDKGKKRTREVYKNGKIVNFSISEYFDDLHIKKEYGWRINISKNSEKIECNSEYKYKHKGGKIIQHTRYDNGKKSLTTKIEYHNNNLIKTIKYNGVTAIYKYEYYQ